MVTTNAGICHAFCDYFQDLFTGEPGLTPAQFDVYLADFHRLESTKGTRCAAPVTESEIWEELNLFGWDNTPELDGFPYDR